MSTVSKRKCNICKKYKELLQFHKSSGNPEKLHTYCKECKSQYNKKWYNKNKTKHKINASKNNVINRNKIRDLLVSYFKDHPCVDCGEQDPVVLEFDHVRGQKISNIGSLLKEGYCWETVLKEISKCDVRCANCHRRRTALVQNWRKRLDGATG